MQRNDAVFLRIAGEEKQAADGQWFERRNPVTGEVATRAVAAKAAEAA